MFILNITLNDIFNTLISNTNGDSIPKLSPYASHPSQDTFEAISPSNPPITIPDSKKN